ncbi:fumarylacetoacetate hydrolase family protein [bacterium]|nr:fumarylacetoacetate hydrolase family protein [bacterium]
MKFGMLRTTSGTRPVGVASHNGQDVYVDLCETDESLPDTLLGILAEGALDRAERAVSDGLQQERFITGTLLAPFSNSQKVLCIGLNYRDHAEETNSEIPSEPVVFGKYANTLIGPEDEIPLPKVSEKVDYEAELVVVIGKAARNVAAADAYDYIAGYTVGHDVSARDWQKGRPGGQWLLGKSPDSFAPVGPFLVTQEEVGDPQQLKISLTLNGETMQDGTTSDMIFAIPELIAHVSQLMTLVPGDLIFTGTPAGVGMARDPRVFLKPGDRVEVTIEKLGTLGNPVVAGK